LPETALESTLSHPTNRRDVAKSKPHVGVHGDAFDPLMAPLDQSTIYIAIQLMR
jgi:hypothetical protein